MITYLAWSTTFPPRCLGRCRGIWLSSGSQGLLVLATLGSTAPSLYGGGCISGSTYWTEIASVICAGWRELLSIARGADVRYSRSLTWFCVFACLWIELILIFCGVVWLIMGGRGHGLLGDDWDEGGRVFGWQQVRRKKRGKVREKQSGRGFIEQFTAEYRIEFYIPSRAFGPKAGFIIIIIQQSSCS